MKVLVPVKRVVDANVKVRVDVPLNCHPAAIRASSVSVTPLGAG